MRKNSNEIDLGDDHWTKVVYEVITSLVPLFIHECRSHVYRSFPDWVMGKKRPLTVKVLGEPFVGLFKHLGDRISSVSSTCDAITLMSYAISLLEQKTVLLSAVDEYDLIQEKANEKDLDVICREMKNQMNMVSSDLHITSLPELKQVVDKTMEYNDKEKDQTFSGLATAEASIAAFKKAGVFLYSHVSKRYEDQSTAVITFHLLYDVVTEKGFREPFLSPAFQYEACIPFDGGLVDNPWHCSHTSNYLRKRSKEAALWSQGPVNSLMNATGKHAYDNNQTQKGVGCMPRGNLIRP